LRVLASFVGGRGHLEPLLPFARALARAGHEVVFAAPAGGAELAAAEGFEAEAVGASRPPSRQRLPLRPVDRAREERDLRERFVRGAARHRVPPLIGLLRRRRPDLVLCDETDFAAGIAAELAGIPRATVIVLAAGGLLRADVVGEALDELRSEHGLPPDPELAASGRGLVLAPFPLRFRDPAHPLPPGTRAVGPGTRAAGPAEGPRGAARRGAPTGRPLVYLTLGTIFQRESGDLLERAIAGLATLPVDVIATVGDELDPSEPGAWPGSVRVERFVPQAELLPDCDLVVSHGGTGTLLGALAHGLPSLLLPIGADQPWNADRAAALGVARTLDAASAPERIAAAAAELLVDAGARAAAAAFRDEFAALPGPAGLVPELEALAGRAARQSALRGVGTWSTGETPRTPGSAGSEEEQQ